MIVKVTGGGGIVVEFVVKMPRVQVEDAVVDSTLFRVENAW